MASTTGLLDSFHWDLKFCGPSSVISLSFRSMCHCECVVLNSILGAVGTKSFSIVDRGEYGIDAIILVDDVFGASAAVQALSFAFNTVFVTSCSDTFLFMVARDHCDHDDEDYDTVIDVGIADDDDVDSDKDDVDGAVSMGDELDDDDDHESDDDVFDDAVLFSCKCGQCWISNHLE